MGRLMQLAGVLAAASLGVGPVELASDHAVFTLRPRELAPLLVG